MSGMWKLEFQNVYTVGTYVPNSGDNFKVRFRFIDNLISFSQSMDVKQKWNAAFMTHCETSIRRKL